MSATAIASIIVIAIVLGIVVGLGIASLLFKAREDAKAIEQHAHGEASLYRRQKGDRA